FPFHLSSSISFPIELGFNAIEDAAWSAPAVRRRGCGSTLRLFARRWGGSSAPRHHGGGSATRLSARYHGGSLAQLRLLPDAPCQVAVAPEMDFALRSPFGFGNPDAHHCGGGSSDGNIEIRSRDAAARVGAGVGLRRRCCVMLPLAAQHPCLLQIPPPW
ncbi:unnamed protein product, partial [Urochloa humidicola]